MRVESGSVSRPEVLVKEVQSQSPMAEYNSLSYILKEIVVSFYILLLGMEHSL